MGDLRKRVIFVKCWIHEEKTRDFRLNEGFEKTCDFRLYVGFLKRKLVVFCVNWGICKEKMRDFHLNGGFSKRKREIFS